MITAQIASAAIIGPAASAVAVTIHPASSGVGWELTNVTRAEFADAPPPITFVPGGHDTETKSFTPAITLFLLTCAY
jgi:hypothetical protein